jgi:hypothetical protein
MNFPVSNPKAPSRGAYNRRPVIDELGQFHPSVMHAAETRGVRMATAYHRARFKERGWRFAEPNEIERFYASAQEG